MAGVTHSGYVTHRVRESQPTGVFVSSPSAFGPPRETDHDSVSSKSSNSTYAHHEKPKPSMPERWSACSRAMKQFDDVTVKGWKEDIDSLLIFAGLFSAIITAFIVEIYKLLQPDTAEATVLLLQQISQQLASPDTPFRNITAQALDNYKPSTPAVRINAVWVTALVLSMIAALFGIVAKQWLRQYLSGISTSSRESVRLRQFRYEGLMKWHVGKIIAFLPILLQISLVLFLHGLLDLLWRLNHAVAGVVTAFAAVSFILYFATIAIPAFCASNPFKSPQSWAFSLLVWRSGQFWANLQPSPRSGIITGENIGEYRPIPGSWRDREIKHIRRIDEQLDQRALSRTLKHSLDEDFLDIVTPCANDLEPEAAASLACEVLTRRAECTLPMLLRSIRSDGPRLVIETFVRRAGERGTSRLIHMVLDVLPRMNDGVERSKISLKDLIFILRKLLTVGERALCEISAHRRAMDTLSLLMDERGNEHVQRASLQLLWEMTHFGCNMDYCPEGIVNVMLCARNAYRRRDLGTFVQACAILLPRLSAPHSHIHDPRWEGREWLREWLSHMEEYFQDQNEVNKKYDPHMQTKWCSGLAAVALKDKTLLREELVTALGEGADIGLVDCDLEEGDALLFLKSIYDPVRQVQATTQFPSPEPST